MNKIALSASIILLIVLPVAPTLAMAAPAPATSSPSVIPSSNPGYRVGPRDLLDIKVYDLPELDGERRVSEDGNISLPLIGDMPVNGLNEQQVTESLRLLLEKKYVQHASVEVHVKEFRSRPISVIGAVKSPGNLAFSGRWTLLEALSAAGGLSEGHGNVVYVIRRADNGLADQVSINLDDLLVRADPRVNVPIFANDLVNVPATFEVTVYCLGEVARPGALVFKSTERLTLLAAVARAGGLSERASHKILIKRGRSDGPREVTVDYKRILDGKDTDIELGQGDVVVVKESFF